MYSVLNFVATESYVKFAGKDFLRGRLISWWVKVLGGGTIDKGRMMPSGRQGDSE